MNQLAKRKALYFEPVAVCSSTPHPLPGIYKYAFQADKLMQEQRGRMLEEGVMEREQTHHIAEVGKKKYPLTAPRRM